MERVKSYSCFLPGWRFVLIEVEFIDFTSLDFVTYREECVWLVKIDYLIILS